MRDWIDATGKREWDAAFIERIAWGYYYVMPEQFEKFMALAAEIRAEPPRA